MRDLFFYGTLRHLPLLEIVMGRSVESLDISSARLDDFLVSAAAEGPFPTIEPKVGAVAQGILVRGLTEQDVARLDFYEGSFEYDLVAVSLDGDRTADVYMPKPGRWSAQEPWSLEDWAMEYGEINNHAAREVMGYYGTKTRDAVALMFPRIRARAGAGVRAAQSKHGAGTFSGKAEILTRHRSYANFFALDDLTLRHERFDGTMTETLDRAIFISNDAAIVLPYDPKRDRVLLVEQIRMGPLARGDRALWQLEPIAGLIDAGETPMETARREAQEEAGIDLEALEAVAEVYSSPGNSTDFHYIFLGVTDLPDDIEQIGGLESEHENIRSHLMSFDALMDLVDGCGAGNGPLTIAALWLARHRERLRSR